MVRETKRKHNKEIQFQENVAQEQKEEKAAAGIVKWILLVMGAGLVIVGLFFAFMMSTGGIGTGDEVEFEIPIGATAGDTAAILAENEVVFSGPLFSLFLRVMSTNDIQAGLYSMPTSVGYKEAEQLLAAGSQSATDSLVIPEGSSVEDIATSISEAADFSYDEVMAVMQDEAFFQTMLAAYPELLSDVANIDEVRYKFEGYLYPATYEIQQGQTIEEMLSVMLATAEDVRQQFAAQAAEAQVDGQPLTYHEVLTLASLIEAEAATPEDRRLISGVFYNRLVEGMAIQSDISILYANEEHSAYVTIEDTEVDSPYNLYQNAGLGPGPFNNPSSEAIEAALNPEASDYFYFVANLRSGEVYYSKTLEEHNLLVEEHVSEADADL